MSYIVQKLFHLLILYQQFLLILLDGHTHFIHAVRYPFQFIMRLNRQLPIILFGYSFGKMLYLLQRFCYMPYH